MTAPATIETAVLEVVLFALKAEVDEAEFRRASEAIMPTLAGMDGFLGRQLYRTDDGRWLDTVRWRDLDAARRAAEVFPTLPNAQPLMGMIDERTITMLHATPM
jgi:hypothetical protein